MTKKVFVFALLALSICAGCDVKPTLSIDGGESATASKPEYANQELQGQIRGLEWRARSGKAEVDPRDANSIRLSLSDEAFEKPCQEMWFAKRVVMVTVPKSVGETVLGQPPEIRTATFFSSFDGGSENAIATEGKVKVTRIENNKVDGVMVIRADSGYEVNGHFEIPVCGGF